MSFIVFTFLNGINTKMILPDQLTTKQLYLKITPWLPEIFRDNSLLLISDVAQPDLKAGLELGDFRISLWRSPIHYASPFKTHRITQKQWILTATDLNSEDFWVNRHKGQMVHTEGHQTTKGSEGFGIGVALWSLLCLYLLFPFDMTVELKCVIQKWQLLKENYVGLIFAVFFS